MWLYHPIHSIPNEISLWSVRFIVLYYMLLVIHATHLSITFVLKHQRGCDDASNIYINGLVLERRNSSAFAMELRLSCTDPSISTVVYPETTLVLNEPFQSNQIIRITESQIDVERNLIAIFVSAFVFVPPDVRSFEGTFVTNFKPYIRAGSL